MNRILIGMLAMAPTWAVASDIGEAASRCWNPPPGVSDQASAAFTVTIDGDGKVLDITVTGYDEADPRGRDIVLRASHAIELCAPYAAPAGEHDVTIGWPDNQPIDPFK